MKGHKLEFSTMIVLFRIDTPFSNVGGKTCHEKEKIRGSLYQEVGRWYYREKPKTEQHCVTRLPHVCFWLPLTALSVSLQIRL